VTTVGKYIRALRIDELPQLFNVRKGDMSVVGPSPRNAPFFVNQFQKKKIKYYLRTMFVRGNYWLCFRYRVKISKKQTLIVKLNFDVLVYKKNISDSIRYKNNVNRNNKKYCSIKVFFARVRRTTKWKFKKIPENVTVLK